MSQRFYITITVIFLLLAGLACSIPISSPISDNPPSDSSSTPDSVLPLDDSELEGAANPQPIETPPSEILADYANVPLPETFAFSETLADSNQDIAERYDNPDQVKKDLDRLGRITSFYVEWWDQDCAEVDELIDINIGLIQFNHSQAIKDADDYYAELRPQDPDLLDAYNADFDFSDNVRVEHYEYEDELCGASTYNAINLGWSHENYLGYVSVLGYTTYEELQSYAVEIAIYLEGLLADAE